MHGKDFAAEFRALAEEAPGTETAARAWLCFMKLVGDPKQGWTAVETLLADHMQSEALAELPGHLRAAARIRCEDVVVEALRGIVEESPHEKVRASALYELKRRGGKYAVVTMCIGGGQGAAGLFQLA